MDIKPLLQELIDYVSQGTPSEAIQGALAKWSAADLRVALFAVLGWLKGQVRQRLLYPSSKEYRPLALDADSATHVLVADWLMAQPPFAEVFEIHAGALRFRDTVPNEERRIIERFVHERYHPVTCVPE